MHVVYVCVVCASNSPFDGREGHAVPAGHLKRIVAGSLAGVRDLVEDRDRPRSGVAIHPSSMLGSLFLMDWIGRRGLGWSVRWAGPTGVSSRSLSVPRPRSAEGEGAGEGEGRGT